MVFPVELRLLERFFFLKNQGGFQYEGIQLTDDSEGTI